MYKREERRLVLHAVKVDVVAPGDELPFEDDSYDFVFSSHVIEHFPDPIRALFEWVRVARRYVVVIAPHRNRTFDIANPLTPVTELMERHRNGFTSDVDRHWSVWTCESFIELCNATGLHVTDHQDPDDKVGNGFTVVIDAAMLARPHRLIATHSDRHSQDSHAQPPTHSDDPGVIPGSSPSFPGGECSLPYAHPTAWRISVSEISRIDQRAGAAARVTRPLPWRLERSSAASQASQQGVGAHRRAPLRHPDRGAHAGVDLT